MNEIIVFDLDGTVADCQHRLHYISADETAKPDWDAFYMACGDDYPMHPTIDICRKLVDDDEFLIYFVTGRSEICRDITMNWLEKNGIYIAPGQLLMRSAKDYRTDDVVKLELVEKAAINDRIVAVFEDRARVVDAWRQRGIKCYQVAEGDF